MILKLLHFLAFSVAIGGGVAAQLLMARIAAHPGAAPQIRPVLRTLSHVGIGGLAVLWLTGLTLWGTRYGFTLALGGSWHLKLAAVLVLTGLAGFSWSRLLAGRTLPFRVARTILACQLGAAVIALAAAIATFGG